MWRSAQWCRACAATVAGPLSPLNSPGARYGMQWFSQELQRQNRGGSGRARGTRDGWEMAPRGGVGVGWHGRLLPPPPALPQCPDPCALPSAPPPSWLAPPVAVQLGNDKGQSNK